MDGWMDKGSALIVGTSVLVHVVSALDLYVIVSN
jgi:hypothetical protein